MGGVTLATVTDLHLRGRGHGMILKVLPVTTSASSGSSLVCARLCASVASYHRPRYPSVDACLCKRSFD